MADLTLADIAARLESLEKAVRDLTAQLAAFAASPAPSEARPKPPKPAPPKRVPPKRAPSETGLSGADASAAAATAEGAPDVEPPRFLGGFQELLAAAFAAVQLEEADEAYAAMTLLTHSDELLAPRAIDHLKAFSWKKFRGSAARYLADDGTFSIERTVPAVLAKDARRVKVFVAPRTGSPAPITLARDPAASDGWRIASMSL